MNCEINFRNLLMYHALMIKLFAIVWHMVKFQKREIGENEI